MGSLIKKIEEWLGGGPGGPGGPGGTKRMRTFRWLILIGLVGAALMILNSYITIKDVEPITTGRASPGGTAGQDSTKQVWSPGGGDKSMFRDYEQAYETRLKDILQKIVGVGDVEVLVTIDSTEEMMVDKNTKESQQTTNEKDQSGATRHVTDITRSGELVFYEVSGNKTPVVIKYIKPKIRGVVVVARGAENATVKKLLSEAVERGLEVPAFRISIVPRKQ